jgi:hypothetical protein
LLFLFLLKIWPKVWILIITPLYTHEHQLNQGSPLHCPSSRIDMVMFLNIPSCKL